MTTNMQSLPPMSGKSAESSAVISDDPAPSMMHVVRQGFPKSSQLVIIGAGIVGAVLAYLFASRSVRWRRIVLLDRDDIGGGSTAKSAACFRLQFTQFVNVAINKLSRELYKGEIAKLLGYNPLKENGYLFLKETPEQLRQGLRHAASQRGWGVEVELLSPREIEERFPFIDTTNVSGATFGAEDGFIASPEVIAKVCVEAAQEYGVQVFTRTDVTKLETVNGKLARVVTTRGVIEADAVINCAGAWSAPIARSVGSSLPVSPVPRQVCFVNAVASVPQDSCPMVIAPNGAYMRPEGQTLMLGYAPPETPPSFEARYDQDLALLTVGMMAEYVPALLEAEIRPNGVSGLYEVTPDKNAIIGADPNCRGLYHCTGFSGHGVMQGPGGARLIYELLELGRIHSLHPMIYGAVSPNRFSLHQSLPEEAVI